MVSWKLLKIVAVEPAGVLPEFLLEGLPALLFGKLLASEENALDLMMFYFHFVIHLLQEHHLSLPLVRTLLPLHCHRLIFSIAPASALATHAAVSVS